MNIKDSAKTILCYGDSNTWGNVPRSDDRYARSIRWPGVLQKLLGEDYEIVSEGLCGRTFVAEDPAKPHYTGITHLQALLESSDPLDLIIIMLGTNDIKNTYDLNAEEIADHLKQTIDLIKDPKVDLEKVPQILIICPPPVVFPVAPATSQAGRDLDEGMSRGPELFKSLPGLYKKVAEEHGCLFLNAGDHVSSSPRDGYHLEPEAHVTLAGILKDLVLSTHLG